MKFGFVKETIALCTLAILGLPFMIKDPEYLNIQIKNFTNALDIPYYQRIFSSENNIFNLGNSYIDLETVNQRQYTFLSVGETITKLIFELLDKNMILTYTICSLVYLVFWIVCIKQIIQASDRRPNLRDLLIVIFVIIALMNKHSIIRNNYNFDRIVSPQLSISLWLATLVLFSKILSNIQLGSINKKHNFLFSILILLSSFTYLYTFLCVFCYAVILLFIFWKNKKYNALFQMIILLTISITPFVIQSLYLSRDSRFAEAAQRSGLINNHLPGSITTILYGSILLISIFAFNYINNKKINFCLFEINLFLSTVCVIIASQSNILTGKEIQSYHFELFIESNMMLYLIYFLRVQFDRLNINSATKNWVITIPYRKLTLIPIFLLTINVIFNFNPFLRNEIKSKTLLDFRDRYSNTTNLIVDVPKLRDNFSIYSPGKILYNDILPLYRFSNFEVLDRYYISSGCPSAFTEQTVSEIFIYRTESIIQKADSISRYSNLLGIENLFENYSQSFYSLAAVEKTKINNEFNTYLDKFRNTSCVDLATKYGVKYIIFDEFSNWNYLSKLNPTKIRKFKLYNLEVFELDISNLGALSHKPESKV